MWNFFKKIKERHSANIERQLNRRVNAKFQIKERDGEIWLTYEGCYVCPCDMLKDSPVDAVRRMRVLYKCRLHDGKEGLCI